jgi:hypothetical protein
MSKMEITVTDVDISRKIDVNVDLGDVLDSINELEIKYRYNYIAKMISGVSTNDISNLDESQVKLIKDYLVRQLEKFN